jgi:hypothetical protein
MRTGKLIAIGAIVTPVMSPTKKGMQIAISHNGTSDDNKTLETEWIAPDDANTSLNPITIATVNRSSMLRLSFNPFKTTAN